MADNVYRVIQWATGNIGQFSIRHFTANPAFDLVGVLVTNPEKIGKDAGEIAGIGPIGVIATDDVEAILALDADCVHFAPLLVDPLKADIEMVCRILRSGKNVVSPLGPFYRSERYREHVERIEAACRDGGTSFHGSGIHPGYAGDILPLTLARLVSRVDHIRVYEIVDYLTHPSRWAMRMGFGRDPQDVKANPSRSPEAGHALAQSMASLADGLGKRIENMTTEIELAVATKDIRYADEVIRAGTVAGQHYAWTAWVDGRPLITFYTIWVMGHENLEPPWDYGQSCYRVAIDGVPPLEVDLTGGMDANGIPRLPGLTWTALAGLTAIPDVCDADPGFVTHFDLGVVRPRGLIRPATSADEQERYR